MPLEILTFNREDKELFLRLLLSVFVLSFVLQIVGFSSTAWICEETGSPCKGINDLDSVIKGLLITGFVLKCIAVFGFLIYLIYKFYKLTCTRNHSVSLTSCMVEYPCPWIFWAWSLSVSEIFSGAIFFTLSFQYKGISWSAYLYSFVSFILLVTATLALSLRNLWSFLKFLEPDGEVETQDVISVRQQTVAQPNTSQNNVSAVISSSTRQTSITPSAPPRNVVSPRQSNTSRSNFRGRSTLARNGNSQQPSTQLAIIDMERYSVEEECSICMERVVEVFLPCSHKLCRACALRIQRDAGSLCPQCRTPFQNFSTIRRR